MLREQGEATLKGRKVPIQTRAQMLREGRWRQADVRRAITAAEKAGLRADRIEIAPDGTISIVVGMPDEASGEGIVRSDRRG